MSQANVNLSAALVDPSDIEDEIELYEDDAGLDEEIDDEVDDMSYGVQSDTDGDPSEAAFDHQGINQSHSHQVHMASRGHR